MAAQALKLAGREYVILPAKEYLALKRGVSRSDKRAQDEDEYWTQAALKAEAEARAKGDKPIPLESVEGELQARRARRRVRR